MFLISMVREDRFGAQRIAAQRDVPITLDQDVVRTHREMEQRVTLGAGLGPMKVPECLCDPDSESQHERGWERC